MPAPLMDTYAPPPVQFTHGEGALLFTEDNTRYIDFIAGIAVNALGHCHPALVQALKTQADQLWHLSNMFQVPGQRALAQRYCDLTFADRVFFTNSGAEAVECALKTARRYHFDAGEPERTTIIGFEGAFHGRTFGAINAGGNPKYLEGFGAPLPGFVHLPFGDHEALDRAVDETTAAIIIEPVQGEGGVRAVPDQCLRGLVRMAHERGALVIYDEVQCGAGRTGKLFAHEWVEGATPDLMAVAKGVGGGFPMGACLATEAVGKVMVPGTHGSTFGGNALAMAVGAAVLDEMTREGFLDGVNAVASQFRQGLEALKDQFPDHIEDVRGRGLLLGMKVRGDNKIIRDAARARGLLVGVAGDNVVRFAPPLVITPELVSEALSILDGVFADVAAETTA